MAQTRPTSGHREIVTAWLIDAVQRGLKAQPRPTSASIPTAQESA
jgi:hypothetical protein